MADGARIGGRARIRLEAAEGALGKENAVKMVGPMVAKRRFTEHRLVGFHDGFRPGTPRCIGDDDVAEAADTGRNTVGPPELALHSPSAHVTSRVPRVAASFIFRYTSASALRRLAGP